MYGIMVEGESTKSVYGSGSNKKIWNFNIWRGVRQICREQIWTLSLVTMVRSTEAQDVPSQWLKENRRSRFMDQVVIK